MPEHAEEAFIFNDFRELEDASEFVRLFNEHSSLDKTFTSRRELDRYIENDYPKLEEGNQKQFIREMEVAMTDMRSDGFEKMNRVNREEKKEE